MISKGPFTESAYGLSHASPKRKQRFDQMVFTKEDHAAAVFVMLRQRQQLRNAPAGACCPKAAMAILATEEVSICLSLSWRN